LMDALTQRHVKVVRTAEFIASITRRNS
jgi:hypothetical protein